MKNIINVLRNKAVGIVAIIDLVYGVLAHHHSLSTLAPYLLSTAGLSTIQLAFTDIKKLFK